MALFRSGRSPRNLSVGARRRVYDVTGAGDTVAAVLALALAAGWSVEVAARVANVAAGIVVSKVGTSYVVPTELLNALNENAPDFVDEFG